MNRSPAGPRPPPPQPSAEALDCARAQWHWRGQGRPPFAAVAAAGQESVWDYPRPPRLLPDAREVIVCWRGLEVARTTRALRLLETAHPPTFYLPPEDVDRSLLRPAPGSSFCEWKGPARYWHLMHGEYTLPAVAWSYPQPLAGAEAVAGHLAFYAHGLQCTVGGAPARPQAGSFYGGWITPELVGPFKGDTGSEGW